MVSVRRYLRWPPHRERIALWPNGSVLGVVAEVGGEPALGLLQGPALALGVVGDLVLGHPTDHEVLRLRVREIPAADGRTGPHRHRLGQLDASPLLNVHQLPERRLLGVLRAR